MSDIDVRAELAHWIENVQDADLAAELADMQAKADAGDDAAMTDAFFQSMAVVIMFGLGFATLLTLVVLPVLYCVFYGIKAQTKAEV